MTRNGNDAIAITHFSRIGEVSFGRKYGLVSAMEDKDDVLDSIKVRTGGLAIRGQMPILEKTLELHLVSNAFRISWNGQAPESVNESA